MTFYLKTGLNGAKIITSPRLFMEMLLDKNDYYKLIILQRANLANNYIKSAFRDHPTSVTDSSILEDLTIKYDTNRQYDHDEIEFYSIYYVIKLITGELIGTIDLYGDTQSVEFGVFIDASHSGKNYGTEAVQSIIQFLKKNSTVRKLKWECDVGNTGSITLAQKCGFVYSNQTEIYPGRFCYVFYLNL